MNIILKRGFSTAMPQKFSSKSYQSVLETLGLSTTAPNLGVYNGKWGGSGPIIESINPTTHQVLGKIQTVHQTSVILSRHGSFYLSHVLYDVTH